MISGANHICVNSIGSGGKNSSGLSEDVFRLEDFPDTKSDYNPFISKPIVPPSGPGYIHDTQFELEIT